MAVTAPSQDTAGAALDAQIATVQALVNAASSPAVLAQYILQLNQLQVAVVDHYMVTGWLNPATILATYGVPARDVVGLRMAARVTFLQNLLNAAPAPLAGNVNGYGGSGWVTVAQNYAGALYESQKALVDHLMDLPGGTSAATILATFTGTQTTPDGNTFNPQAPAGFQYKFNSVGFTDSWIDD